METLTLFGKWRELNMNLTVKILQNYSNLLLKLVDPFLDPY